MPKILLADDSTHAQRMGVKILSAEGFEVTTVSNGKAAIDSFKKSTPDLVVADVFMPGRNGYEVCQHVKTSDELKHIPVLLIIGAMEPYDPEEGKKAGADGVITKPLESSNLLSMVKGLIEAAKHFAPAKAIPKKEKSKPEEAVAAGPDPYAPVVEDPAWAAAEEEVVTTTTKQEELVIPQAIKQQPVGMLTELLDTGETPAAAPLPAEEFALPQSSGDELPGVPDALSLDAAVAAAPVKSSLPTWTAQAAEVSEEDSRLFEEASAAPAPSWSDLTQMAAAVSEDTSAAMPLPWQTEPDLIRADETPVAAGTAEGIEHFENLNETISSYAPVSPAALGIGVQPIPLTPVEEAGPSMPSYDEEIILSPADVAAGTSPGTITSTIDPNFDRGFEPITSSVPLPLPVEEPAPEPVTAAVEEPVAAVEASAAAQTPAAPPRDPLVEAAVAMVREATEKELAADAAASPDAASAPPVDPATLEHVIRGVVGELMPQIVAQVKSALKS